MARLQQDILIRTDLGFSTGLLAAQVAHIHMEGIRRAMLYKGVWGDDKLTMAFADKEAADAMVSWLETPYIFVRRVPNLETLEFFEKKISSHEGLTCDIWRDTVFMEIAPDWTEAFADVKVGLSIGPADSDEIKQVVGKLPLL